MHLNHIDRSLDVTLVKDLFDVSGKKIELVRFSFPAKVCSSILAMPISWGNVEDKLCICAGH